MEPAEAVRLAYDLRAQVAKGVDPQELRRATAEEPTLDQFFTNEYLPTAQTLRSLKDIKFRWRHISPVFGHLRFRELRTADIVRFHNAKRIELCAATSNRILALLKRVINVGMMLERCERNPCRGVRMHLEDNVRNRTLAGEELSRFLSSLAQEPAKVAADVFLFALATAARREEILQLTWSEISMEEGLWRLPASRAKSAKARVIPLNEVALQVLERRAAAGKGVYVFPGRFGKHLSNPTKALKRVALRAGISDLKFHDLRRSAATLLLNDGASLSQAGRLLGHAPGSTVTATRYAFLGDEQLANAAHRLAGILSAASGPTPNSSP